MGGLQLSLLYLMHEAAQRFPLGLLLSEQAKNFLTPRVSTRRRTIVHHAVERKCIDRNFGGVLIIWDRLLGTFARESAEYPEPSPPRRI